MVAATFAPATNPQINFIRILATERAVTLDESKMARLSLHTASAAIDKLMAMPKSQPTSPPVATAPVTDFRAIAARVPAGRYAIRTDDVTKFYRVNKPTEGRWQGYTFVDVQASDEFHPIRGATVRGILAAIGTDPQAAAILYGKELGVCGICGRTLTDEDSRAYGIGPVCREKSGW